MRELYARELARDGDEIPTSDNEEKGTMHKRPSEKANKAEKYEVEEMLEESSETLR